LAEDDQGRVNRFLAPQPASIRKANMDKRMTMTSSFKHAAALGALALAAAAGSASAQTAPPTNSNLPPGALPSSWDATYNVCRGTDPKCYNNWVTNRQNKVLIYTRTAGPRHANLGTALAAGLNPALNDNNTLIKGLVAWLAAEGITADWTEDVTRWAA
jgi:hypothetical protein